MRALIVGVGSIGTRHLKNLIRLGHQVYVVDQNQKNLKHISRYTDKVFTSVSEGIKANPEIAFICTYSNNHIAPAIECAKAGCHLFIEKPLSVHRHGLDELIKIAKSKKLVTMVGCNMRFHPAVLKIKKYLDSKRIVGRPLWADFEFGFYLPFAKKDYTSSYMARKELGGNIIFDGIHEIDYATWFFGKPRKVFCNKNRLSKLHIDTDDYVDFIIEYKNGIIARFHTDYLQHGYSRRCKIVGDRGVIVWDFALGVLGYVKKKTKRWKLSKLRLEIYYNQMYIDQLKYFLKCLKDKKETFNNLEYAAEVLNLALTIDKSSRSRNWELLQ